MPHMSCLDHTPDKQYLGHIFEHCQRVRWALHPILLNLHTLWNRPAHPSHLALKTERNLHPLCGKGVHLYRNYQHLSIYDNPNAVLQVGDGFGFIIRIENIL